MGKPLSAVKPFSDEKKWEDDVDWMSFPDGKQVIVRVFGTITVLARVWIDTLSNKRFPMWDPSFDSDSEDWDRSKPCPSYDDFQMKSQKVIVGQCISRKLQDQGEANPIRGFLIPHAANSDIIDIVNLIKADPADPEKGVDLAIRYSAKAAGNKKWGIQRGDNTPLTDEEKELIKNHGYDFDAIIPDFKDPEVVSEYAMRMKESMARMKYYVVQTERVPEGVRDPLKFFKGDVNGKPWTTFPVLVDYRNEQAGDDAKKFTVVDGGDDSSKGKTAKEEDIADEPEDDLPPPPAEKEEKKPDPEPETKEESKESVHPDSSIGSKEHPDMGTVPECFQDYDGSPKCNRCPVRAKCIDMTDDDL